MPKTPAGDTGLPLDENDPDDARIIARQRRAAHTAGRNGRDRARTTRGRADLEAAYDEGAAATAAQSGDEDQGDEDEAPAPSTWSRTKTGAKAARDRVNRWGAPLSKGSWKPTASPSRARDAGGLLTGALVYTAVVVYIRYGPDGWKGWLKAKFLNQPMQGLPNNAGSQPAPAPPKKAVPT